MTIIVDRYTVPTEEFEVIRIGDDNHLEVGRLMGARYVTVMHDLRDGVKYIEYRIQGNVIKTALGGYVGRRVGTKLWEQINDARLKVLIPKGFLTRELVFAPPYDR